MIGFQKFNPATGYDTPDFMEAEIAEAKHDAEETARANALRSQNLMGSAMIYNYGMGDKTPIADKFGEWFGGGAKPPAMKPAPTGVDNALSGPASTTDLARANNALPSQTPTEYSGIDNAMSSRYGNSGVDNALGLDSPYTPNAGTPTPTPTPTPTVNTPAWDAEVASEFAGQGNTPAWNADVLSQTGELDAASAFNNAAPLTDGNAAAFAESQAAANAVPAAPTAGASSGLMGTMPYIAAALAADEMLFDGQGREDLTDPDKYVDALGATFGKGWLWS